MAHKFFEDKKAQYIYADLAQSIKYIKAEYKKQYNVTLTAAEILNKIIEQDPFVTDLKRRYDSGRI